MCSRPLIAALLMLTLACDAHEPPVDAVKAPHVASAETVKLAPAPNAKPKPTVLSKGKSSQTKDDGLNRGEKAADFSGAVVYGGEGELSLYQFIGESKESTHDGAIVAFGASWCGYCKASLETLKELQTEHKNLAIVYVGIDDTESGWQREVAIFEEKEVNFPLVRVANPDSLRQQYFGDKRNIPRFYLVDHTGTIRVKDQGFTKKKMGKLLPKQVRYLLGLAKRDSAASPSGASPG